MTHCVLTIAGSDSGGNAGVQADLRTFHSYGLHGCTVFTALTAQNPDKVLSIHPVPSGFVASQLDAVLGVYDIVSLKTGMLSECSVIEEVAGKLLSHPEIAKVVDPVMVATSGARLIGEGAVEALKKHLLPLARIITPNIPEAEKLSGVPVRSADDVREAARRLNGEYGCAVLVKGGHATGPVAEDILFDGGEFSYFSMPWIERPLSTHGTGCTLAAAIVSGLALGKDLKTAVREAKRHVHDAIASSYLVGRSCGVLGFCHNSQRLTTNN
jgi:hydroxymethylpyrimidine/phosphomethylpyrimidine kinase